MTNKVYCFDCTYYRYNRYSFNYGHACLKNSELVSTPFEKWITYGDPRLINKNNDCSNFKPTRWFRIKEFTKLVKYYLKKDFKHE